MKNPYAGVKNPYEHLENVYEDVTVNLKQAEFEKEQCQQEQQIEARARQESGRLQQVRAEGEQKRDLLEREGARMVEKFEIDKVNQQLAWARERKMASDTAIDQAAQQLDQFVAGAVTEGLGAGMKMLSDIRLKENITHTGQSESGIPIYTFNYKGDNELWSGTMAQDLLGLGREDAVGIMDNGYYGVYYDKIDVNMTIKNKN